ncbi:MAG TPA: UvrD-helicase domain-containing protein [Candidatus Omnitrophota bacterium]|mgnify:CR=1 FL=1|nr:UvrD-helicase domain-containing protein [Candidatus Omnitrophota bacterium]HPS36406.1 UvrD-helicase domain-containing protein [Candidatus Omnitrophota bacterium]
MTLTSAQEKAVQSLGKNLLVSAGAGTGKTRVLVERILHLLKTEKARITELLVLTFTEKAANEIKGRLSVELRKAGMERPRRDLERAAISTFHGFASRLLKEHPVEAGVDPEFRVLESEQSELLKEEALQATIEKVYETKNDAFELLAAYGEDSARAGILKVFTAARHEGKLLREFFEENDTQREAVSARREKELAGEAPALIEKLPEIDAGAWERFFRNKTWDWETLSDFWEWSSLYKGKRKEGWKEWRGLLEDLAALRIGPLAVPWQKKLETLALLFEEAYDAKKKEKGLLDFDDLQRMAVGLFAGTGSVLAKLRERYQKQFKYILIDEFQDTNFLQMRFAELLSSGDNLFMVGDYKQSIYGFRGAEPRLFLEKEAFYADGEAGERIFLAESFRSEPLVVDFVNGFFAALWDEDGFSFEPLAAKKKQESEAPAVELLVTEVEGDEEKEHARMREARAIALRIGELHEKGVPYGEMAILFQAMTVSGIYEDALKTAGVPYFIVAGRGFYEQPEIQDMMSFLTHLEKPLSDIPLAAVLRSPFFHVTDDTLFWLSRDAKKNNNDAAPLYEAVKRADGISEIAEEQKRQLRAFTAVAAELRGLKDRVSLAELIDRILERTGYELSALAGPSGVRRFANLKKLIAIVREYETYERVPLAVFLNILERLRARDVRESEAQIALEDGAQAVRMMSVHAAKGLEFGAVFVADMGHQGRHGEAKTVIAHAAEGFSMRFRNEKDLEPEEPYFYKAIDRAVKKRENEEWKRLFYVAVTRAKSRLFLSGVYAKKKKEKELFSEMTSWMDWAMALAEGLGVRITCDADKDSGIPVRRPAVEKEKIARIVEKFEAQAVRGAGTFPGLRDKSERAQPRTIDLPVSAFVLFRKDPGEFWRRYQIGWTVFVPEDQEKVTGIGPAVENEWAGKDPDWKGEEVRAADFGTAMHTFFEHLDLKQPELCLESGSLERLFGHFGKESVAGARELVKGFIQSPVFKQLQKARRIERETDFVLNGRHGLIYGKLDVLFEDEQGEWHILDYKTATGDEAAAKKSSYDLQLEIYALAAQKILKLPVRSGILYYLKNQKAVTLPFPAEKTEAFFDGLEKKICDLQHKILDYSNERMATAPVPAEG